MGAWHAACWTTCIECSRYATLSYLHVHCYPPSEILLQIATRIVVPGEKDAGVEPPSSLRQVVPGCTTQVQSPWTQLQPMSGLFEHRTIVQIMWQADLYGVAKFVTDCLGVYYDTDPRGGQASDQP